MADSLITYCYVQPACSAFLLHSCKNSHVCGASDHETVIHFVSDTAPRHHSPVYSFGLGFIASCQGKAALPHLSTLTARGLPSGDDADSQSPNLSLLAC